MIFIKFIFIFVTTIFALTKLLDGMNYVYTKNDDKIINLIEIVVSIFIVIILFKV